MLGNPQEIIEFICALRFHTKFSAGLKAGKFERSKVAYIVPHLLVFSIYDCLTRLFAKTISFVEFLADVGVRHALLRNP